MDGTVEYCTMGERAYVQGMAPRVDRLEAHLANEPVELRYVCMMAYARWMEMELTKARKTISNQTRSMTT